MLTVTRTSLRWYFGSCSQIRWGGWWRRWSLKKHLEGVPPFLAHDAQGLSWSEFRIQDLSLFDLIRIVIRIERILYEFIWFDQDCDGDDLKHSSVKPFPPWTGSGHRWCPSRFLIPDFLRPIFKKQWWLDPKRRAAGTLRARQGPSRPDSGPPPWWARAHSTGMLVPSETVESVILGSRFFLSLLVYSVFLWFPICSSSRMSIYGRPNGLATSRERRHWTGRETVCTVI